MKVSLYLNDELWAKFKRAVLRQTGDARSLSSKVQDLIQNSMLQESVAVGFRRMGVTPNPVDPSAVAPVVPSVATSSGQVLRGMRGSRHEKAKS